MTDDVLGVATTSPGSQASPGVADASPPPVSIPNAWHHSCLEKPAQNSRIVVIYFDGSGARLGFWTGETVIEGDGDSEWMWDETPGEMWAYLPNGFQLWCETREDDPYTFPASAIEARSDETGTGSVEDESAAPNGGDAR